MKTALTLVVLAAASLGFQQAANAAAPVPRPAPALSISDPSGKPIALSAYKGKVVVVQFLYTTCPHCQKFSQVLTKLQNELALKGFQAVGVAFDEAPRKRSRRISKTSVSASRWDTWMR